VSQYILRDWPEDRLPMCSVCRQEIKNGESYIVPRGSILFSCVACSKKPDEPLGAIYEEPDPSISPLSSSLAVLVHVPAPIPRKTERPPRAPRPTVPRTVQTLTCTACGAPLSRRNRERSKRAFCSRAEALEFKRKEHEQRLAAREIPCPVCQTPFTPTPHGKRGPQRVCSRSCAGSTAAPRQRLSVQTCPPCGREYRPNSRKQKYCTNSCRFYGIRGLVNPHPAPIRWAHKYDKCVDCGETKRRHLGNGQCSRCYYPPSLVPKWEGEESTLKTAREA
jgi:hypothetical protein